MAWPETPKTLKCAHCGATLAVVGVTVVARETLLYLGEMGDPGMRRVASVGPREIDDVKCRNCLTTLTAKAVEMLQIA